MTLKIEGTGFQDGGIIQPSRIKDCNGCATLPGVGGILCSTGNNIEWVAPPFLGCSLLTAKGDIIAATAPSTATALPVGTDGQVLTACAACASGLTWAAAGGGGGASPATPSVAGIVLGITNSNNTAIGCSSLGCITSGGGNVAMGCSALGFLTNGIANTAIGTTSLFGLSTGSFNTSLGDSAGQLLSGVCCNTAIGFQAMQRMTTGGCNTAVGSNALFGTPFATNSGSFNTGVGNSAINRLTTGSCNSALGNFSLNNLTTGSNNTAAGAFAGSGIDGGSFNTILGATLCGCGITSGCGNVVLGVLTGAGAVAPVFNPTTESNRVVVGSTAVTNAYVQVAWTVVSDARDKIVEGDVPHGLEFVNQLEPKAFYFKENRESEDPNGPLRYGFLAQDVMALEGPQTVIIDNEDPDKLRYNGESLIPVLVNAIKELSAKNDELEARLRALEIPG